MTHHHAVTGLGTRESRHRSGATGGTGCRPRRSPVAGRSEGGACASPGAGPSGKAGARTRTGDLLERPGLRWEGQLLPGLTAIVCADGNGRSIRMVETSGIGPDGYTVQCR